MARWGKGHELRLPVLLGAALIAATAASADEMQPPHFTVAQVDWTTAAASMIASELVLKPADVFADLDADTGKRFPGIAKSSVPVLLPMDVDAFRRDAAAGSADTATSDKYFSEFHPSKFFIAGPAGYMATFFLNPGEGGFRLNWPKPVEVQIAGAAFTYDLDGPNFETAFPTNGLEFIPGIRRIFREAHMRYAFERFGVTYVVSIQCYDRPPSSRYISCRETDPIAMRVLHLLQIAGGTPMPIKQPQVDLTEPQQTSDFTYYGPGNLIPNTGYHRTQPGRADYHVYANMRFPIALPTAYVKSQSFMPWGDCYRTGHIGPYSKTATYRCAVNDIPMVFDEGAAANFTYPWRDNFCEMRDFDVGQCPGGWGHQGEDIRPADCVISQIESTRCLPYKHTVAAVRDGMVWRNRGDLAAYIVADTADDFVRFRYLHMNPRFMDEDGLFSGREVSQGEIIGKVADWGDSQNGTSYHLHFNMQVFTRSGWVWVNPYMTLVLAYEQLIGGRGKEIKPGDPVPPVPDKLPVVENPPPPLPKVAAVPEPPKAAPIAKPVQYRHPLRYWRGHRRQ